MASCAATNARIHHDNDRCPRRTDEQPLQLLDHIEPANLIGEEEVFSG